MGSFADLFELQPQAITLRPIDTAHLDRIMPGVRRIRRLAELADDWDSYGGRAPSEGVVHLTLLLLTAVLRDPHVPSPTISPGSDGSLQLEWHIGGVNVELEVTPSHEVLALVAKGTEVILEQPIGSDRSELIDIVSILAPRVR